MIGETHPEIIETSSSTASIISAIVSSICVLILIILASLFLIKYGRRNPGGWAEKIALRLETPYKRFGILEEDNNNDQVEMGHKPMENNNSENINTTVAF